MKRTIVSGEFATEPQAARAVDRLLRACIGGEQVRAFFLNEPEPRRRMPARRVESQHVRRSIGRGAAVALDLGPAAVAGGVEVSAYARGTYAAGTGDAAASSHHARILVAVETRDQVSQALAVNVLWQHGARAIERIHTPRASRAGFHPVSLSSLLEQSEPQPMAGQSALRATDFSSRGHTMRSRPSE